MNTATFKKGADIILEAKLSDYAYIIEEGSVEVSKRRPD
jgi:CRP-like cAMP-binding protein